MAKDPLYPFLLRRMRLQHGLTQSQFAEIAGVEPKTVQRWERGVTSPRPFSLQRLCAHFNTTPAELGLLDTDPQHEESQETPASTRLHREERLASADHRRGCCLLLVLLGSLPCLAGCMLAGQKCGMIR
jgi:transcriptional regulator with XRE-family HTH domain